MQTLQNQSVRVQLAHLVATHGRLHISAMLLALILRPKPPHIPSDALSDHLRRDIGLERAPPSKTYRDYL